MEEKLVPEGRVYWKSLFNLEISWTIYRECLRDKNKQSLL